MKDTLKEIIVSIFIFAAVMVVYWRVTGFGFAAFDDQVYVTQNPMILRGMSLEGVNWALTAFHGANWHPLTWLAHMTDVDVFGVAPGGHHLSNLLLHGLNSMGLFLLLKQMTGVLGPSALAAILFALHPLHVESVAWISERKDLLCTFWGWLSLWAYGRYAQNKQRQDYLLCFLFLGLGLMSKPMLVTWPFLMFLLDRWPLRRWPGGDESLPDPALGVSMEKAIRYRTLILEKLPLLGLSILSCVVTFAAQHSGGAVQSVGVFPVSARIANALTSYANYLFKAFWPLNLSVFYPYDISSLVWWKALCALALILSLTGIALILRDRHAYLTLGWFWFLGTLVPVIGLVQVGTQAMADRYTYIPLTGLFIIAAWGGKEVCDRWPRIKNTAVLLSALILALLAIRTVDQLRHWENDLTLFSHAVQVHPESGLARNNLAAALYARGKVDESILHLDRALEIDPQDLVARNNLVKLLILRGRFPEAEAHIQINRKLDPEDVTLIYLQGFLRMEQGAYKAAMEFFLKAITLDPEYADAYHQAGRIFEREGRRETALVFYAKARLLKPDLATAAKTGGDRD